MSHLEKFVVIVSALWSVLAVVCFAHIDGLFQLAFTAASVFYLIAFFVSIVCILEERRQRRWRSLIPLAVCVTIIPATVGAIRFARDFLFARSLPGYEAVVHQIASGAISVSSELTRTPQAEPQAGAYRVLARRDQDNVLSVEFHTGGNFPVKHRGYLYVSSGIIEPGSFEDSRWPSRHKEKPQWFYVSD
jgi:hypothetical protein